MATNTTTNLTPSDIRALEKRKRQELNLQRIKDANKKRYEEGCVSVQLSQPIPPERKPAMILPEEGRSFLTRDSFVKVEAALSGQYRPDGYGYITICHGVGGAALYDVKYTPVYDGGRIHRRIPLSCLTSCSPFDDILPEGAKRRRRQVVVTPPPPLPKIDDRLPIEKLRDALIEGLRRGKKKGWYRRTLGWDTGSWLNDREKKQFTIELLLLEQHLNETTVVTDRTNNLKRYKKSGYFKKSKCPPVSLKYFVQTAWGLSNSYLCRFKKAMLKQAEDMSVDIFASEEEEDDAVKPIETVITSATLAASYFTPQYLFALNECRQLAIEDPSSVTTAERWDRFRSAKDRFKSLDPDMLATWQVKSREHIHRQPHIASQLITYLQANSKRSWLGLEADIDNWCSAATIRMWFTSRPTFGYYSERIFPFLLPHQKRTSCICHSLSLQLGPRSWKIFGDTF